MNVEKVIVVARSRYAAEHLVWVRFLLSPADPLFFYITQPRDVEKHCVRLDRKSTRWCGECQPHVREALTVLFGPPLTYPEMLDIGREEIRRRVAA